MKRNVSILLASLLVAAVAFAPVALASPVGTLELNGGYAKSSTEFGIDANDAPGGGISFGAGYWRPASPSISWGAEVAFDNLGNTEYLYDDGFVTGNAKVSESVIRFSPQVRFNLSQGVGTGVFFQGGLGYYKVNAKLDLDGVDLMSGDESKIGFNLGAGVNFPVAPTTKMNVGVQYHTISTEVQSTNYLNFRAGVGFNL